MIRTIRTAISIAIRNPRLAKDLFRLHILGKVIGHRNYKRFVVLSRGRTGSGMLIGMLNSHPSIYARGEIFIRLNGRSVEEILNKIYCKYPRSIRAVGFKIFYYHPFDDKSGRVWDSLNGIEDLYVIHLKRRNILRTELSRKIASVNGVYAITRHNTNELGIKAKQVHYTKDELLKWFEWTRKWETDFGSMFESRAMLDIYYEDLVSNPQVEFQKITNMLDLEYSEPSTGLKKQNPEKMSDLIVNYESLKKEFMNTEWSCFFED